MWLHT